MKYKDAWYLNGRHDIKCTKVMNHEGYAFCYESDIDALGRTMYPTKSQLIEAQIEYWVNQREPVLMAVIGKCPDCGEDMADYAGLDLDNKWRTGCSKRCGYYTDAFQISPESEQPVGFAVTPDKLKSLLREECDHEGDDICKHNMHSDDCFRCRLLENHKSECQHESNMLFYDDEYSFIRECAGNKYYLCDKTNEVHCGCGCEADFPHKCKCTKCGEFYK